MRTDAARTGRSLTATGLVLAMALPPSGCAKSGKPKAEAEGAEAEAADGADEAKGTETPPASVPELPPLKVPQLWRDSVDYEMSVADTLARVPKAADHWYAVRNPSVFVDLAKTVRELYGQALREAVRFGDDLYFPGRDDTADFMAGLDKGVAWIDGLGAVQTDWRSPLILSTVDEADVYTAVGSDPKLAESMFEALVPEAAIACVDAGGHAVCAEDESLAARAAKSSGVSASTLAERFPGFELERANVIGVEDGYAGAIATDPGVWHAVFTAPVGEGPRRTGLRGAASPGRMFGWAAWPDRPDDMPELGQHFGPEIGVFALPTGTMFVVPHDGVEHAEALFELAWSKRDMALAAAKQEPRAENLEFARSTIELGDQTRPLLTSSLDYQGQHHQVHASFDGAHVIAVFGDAAGLARVESVGGAMDEATRAPLPDAFLADLDAGRVREVVHLPGGKLVLGDDPYKVLPTMTDEMAGQVWTHVRRLLAPAQVFGGLTIWRAEHGERAVVHAVLEAFGRADTEEGKLAMQAVEASIRGERGPGGASPYAALVEQAADSRYITRYRGRLETAQTESLMIGVAVAGILAAIAIPALTKYMRKARTTEAKIELARLVDLAVAYTKKYGTCPANGASSAGPTPSLDVDCNAGPGGRCSPGAASSPDRYAATVWSEAGWKELGFAMSSGHYYHYEARFSAIEGGCRYTFTAHGDLDGDKSKFSKFTRSVEVVDGKATASELEIVDELE